MACLPVLFERMQDPDRSLCADLVQVAKRRPRAFREPELLEAVSEILMGKGVKVSIQPSGGREEPRHAQVAACDILTVALKVMTKEGQRNSNTPYVQYMYYSWNQEAKRG